LYRRLGGPQGRSGRAENLVPTRIRSRTVQHVAQSLYRLSYPAHTTSFDIHKVYMVLTVLSIVLYGLYGPSETLRDWFRKTEVENVYCAVRTVSLYKTKILCLNGYILWFRLAHAVKNRYVTSVYRQQLRREEITSFISGNVSSFLQIFSWWGLLMNTGILSRRY